MLCLLLYTIIILIFYFFLNLCFSSFNILCHDRLVLYIYIYIYIYIYNILNSPILLQSLLGRLKKKELMS